MSRRNNRVRMLNYRASLGDAALLALVAGRLCRSRSDTLRLLVRAAAAELGEAGRTEGQHATE